MYNRKTDFFFQIGPLNLIFMLNLVSIDNAGRGASRSEKLISYKLLEISRSLQWMVV
jgi:hypothetical protein